MFGADGIVVSVSKFLFEDSIKTLLDELCVKWGLCTHPDAFDEISSRSYLTASEFASAVLDAEGISPEVETGLFRKLKRRFIDEFGAEIISVNEYNLD